MSVVDAVSEVFRALRFPLDATPAPGADETVVATLPFVGARRAWLEISLPAPLGRASAARLLAREPGDLDDAAMLDGVERLLQVVAARLAAAGQPVGEATIAVRATGSRPHRPALRVDGHPVAVTLARAA